MANYLDKAGLSTLWSKIKDLVSTSVQNVTSTIGDYTINGKKISTNPSITKEDLQLGNVTNDAQVKRSEMGVANGVATLNANGKIPTEQLDIDTTLFEVVTSLPSDNIKTNIIYLLAAGTSGTQNKYIEYIYADGAWEKLGEFKAEVELDGYVKGPDSSTVDHIATFNGADGKTVKDSGFTIATSVPANAVFTDNSVTAVGNHYAPAEDAASELNASADTITDVYANSVPVVTGVKRDAKGHIVGVVSKTLKAEVVIPEYNKASAEADGLMSKEDFNKLAAIASGATADSAIPTSEIEAVCV